MLEERLVGDMCAPYRKKITPNQDRRTRAALLIWRGLEDAGGGLRVSMEFETVAIATPCFFSKGCSRGSLPLLFYPESNAIGNLRAFSRDLLFRSPSPSHHLSLSIFLLFAGCDLPIKRK